MSETRKLQVFIINCLPSLNYAKRQVLKKLPTSTKSAADFFFKVVSKTTVKLGYNELGYNELPVITNKFSPFFQSQIHA